MNIVCLWIINWLMMLYSSHVIPDPTGCALSIFTTQGLFDILRAASFFLVVTFCTKDYSHVFPLPFTWIFGDFGKFIFEPVCAKIFCDFLFETEDKASFDTLQEMMRMYITVFRENEIGESKVTTKPLFNSSYISEPILQRELSSEDLNMFLLDLQPSFERYKQTISYQALCRKIKEFEEISEKVYR